MFMGDDVKTVAMTAVFISLVFVFTIIVTIAIPATKGFWNVGEAGVYIAAILAGPIIGAVAGGIGSALADIVLGYAIYAPGTLIIKGSEGFIVGGLYKILGDKETGRRDIPMTLAVLICCSGLLSGMLYIYGSRVGVITVELPLALFDTSIILQIHYILLLLVVILITIISVLLLVFGGKRMIMIYSCLVGGFVMVLGYFLYETLLVGGEVALVEVVPNFIQVIMGILIAIPVIEKLEELGVIAKYRESMG